MKNIQKAIYKWHKSFLYEKLYDDKIVQDIFDHFIEWIFKQSHICIHANPVNGLCSYLTCKDYSGVIGRFENF